MGVGIVGGGHAEGGGGRVGLCPCSTPCHSPTATSSTHLGHTYEGWHAAPPAHRGRNDGGQGCAHARPECRQDDGEEGICVLQSLGRLEVMDRDG